MEVDNMDVEDDIFSGIHIPDESSGSEYQTSEAEQDHSQHENARSKTSSNPKSSFLVNPNKRRESAVKLEDVRAKKRWRQSLKPKYRDVLNSDIVNAVARNIPEDNIPLEGSQIGSTEWSADEKDRFFIALSRVGRDNVKLIATQIGTKSELEVQEYMQLLHASLITRRIDGQMLELPDFPAAFEISESCCQQLEKTADAFALLQETTEIETEKAKWGDSWLLTPEISHWLNKRRNQEGGTEAIDEVLPAANLFNLDKWLELSDRVFMNPGEEESNWHNLAQDGQVPSIRATAFEDLHSLAVFMTKKLISTTLYCTMSRERATQAHKIKHAEVTPADVEAAANILKMSHNSDDFWRKCARRCKLRIIDDDNDDADGSDNDSRASLAYDEVETALSTFPHRRRSRSRSRSISHLHIPPEELQPTQSDESEAGSKSADESALDDGGYAETESDSDSGSISFSDTGIRTSKYSKVAHAREERLRAMESYTESMDSEESRQEELRLWKILGQPRISKEEEVDLTRPKRLVAEFENQVDWREKLRFKSEWEVMDSGMVEEEAFARNRVLKREQSRRRRRTMTAKNEGQEKQEMLSSEYVEDDQKASALESGNDAGESEELEAEDEVTDPEESDGNHEEAVDDRAVRAWDE